jgi:hypothetical protein
MERPISTTLRSEVQVGVAKTRRRYTRTRVTAQSRFLLVRGPSNKLSSPGYVSFIQFYQADCLGGARPFYFTHPFSKILKAWRWTEEPQLSDYEGKFIQVTCAWEEM